MAERSSRSVELGTAARLHGGPAADSELVDENQIVSAVAIDQLGQVLIDGRFDQFVDGQDVADSVSGFGGQSAQREQQVALAGARVTDQSQRVSGFHPGAGG